MASQYSRLEADAGPPPSYSQPGVYEEPLRQPVAAPGAYQRIVPQSVVMPVTGLEYLSVTDRLFVKQELELLEVLTSFETCNRYTVYNSEQQVVFRAEGESEWVVCTEVELEQSGCCGRQCCGSARAFTLSIRDTTDREVIVVKRPCKCTPCCPCSCCLQDVTVEDADGAVMGYIRQEWTFCKPRFKIQDAQGKTVLMLTGPICKCKCMGDVAFNVFQPERPSVPCGLIAKKWSGFVKEMFTDADNFGVNFPLSMPVGHKALVLVSTFLIDFMYFEQGPSKSSY